MKKLLKRIYRYLFWTKVEVSLTEKEINLLRTEAKKYGLDFDDYINKLLLEAFKKADDY